jgi:hypothetical protein
MFQANDVQQLSSTMTPVTAGPRYIYAEQHCLDVLQIMNRLVTTASRASTLEQPLEWRRAGPRRHTQHLAWEQRVPDKHPQPLFHT